MAPTLKWLLQGLAGFCLASVIIFGSLTVMEGCGLLNFDPYKTRPEICSTALPNPATMWVSFKSPGGDASRLADHERQLVVDHLNKLFTHYDLRFITDETVAIHGAVYIGGSAGPGIEVVGTSDPSRCTAAVYEDRVREISGIPSGNMWLAIANTAAHEVGHILGYNHSPDYFHVMHSPAQHGPVLGSHLVYWDGSSPCRDMGSTTNSGGICGYIKTPTSNPADQ